MPGGMPYRRDRYLARYRTFRGGHALACHKGGEEYDALKKSIGRQLIATAERICQGYRGTSMSSSSSTPLSSEHWVNAVQGAMYGPEATPDQMGRGRFSACTPPSDGLFLAGAGTIALASMPASHPA